MVRPGRWIPILALVAGPGQAEVRRVEEPVILTGAELSQWEGAAPEDIAVFRWDGDLYIPIPFQVDAAGPSGDLFEADETPGAFDRTDQLVFMVEDLGLRAPDDAWVDGADPVRYAVRVRDPREESEAWAYGFTGHRLSVSSEDYVENPETDPFEVRTDRFIERFLPGNPGVLTEVRILEGLGGDGRDLVDRVKYRAKSGPLLPWLTEDDGSVNHKGTVPIDGPVRVVLRFWVSLGNFLDMMEGTVTFYRQMTVVRSTVHQLIPPSVAHMVWLADAAPEITDLVYFTNSGSQGRVDPVDGDGQRVIDAAGTYHEWVSPTAGSVVMIQDPAAIPGDSRDAYYCDGCDEGRWPETGDGERWGEWGTWVKGVPFGSNFTTDAWHVWLSPADTSRGAEWLDRYHHPVEVDATWERAPAGVGSEAPGRNDSGWSVRPNPFNPVTRICFQDGGGPTEVVIHDLSGRGVRTLRADRVGEGIHCVRWDGTDDRGRSLPSGVYRASRRHGGQLTSQAMVLLK